MSITKKGYFTDLDGNPVTPILVGDASDDEFQYMAILVTYDIPAPHIQGISQSCADAGKKVTIGSGSNQSTVSACTVCNKLCATKLKSMRNALNYWLREKAMRVSDSEYMIPQTDAASAKKLTDEFEEVFREGFGEQYTEWGLPWVMNWYKIVLSARGAMTKAAMTLKTLYRSVHDILSSVTQAIRWHENFQDNATFDENKLIFGDEEKRKQLHAQQVKQWKKKFENYESVLDDFLSEDSAVEAGLGTVAVIEKDMNNIATVIDKAARIVGVE